MDTSCSNFVQTTVFNADYFPFMQVIACCFLVFVILKILAVLDNTLLRDVVVKGNRQFHSNINHSVEILCLCLLVIFLLIVVCTF